MVLTSAEGHGPSAMVLPARNTAGSVTWMVVAPAVAAAERPVPTPYTADTSGATRARTGYACWSGAFSVSFFATRSMLVTVRTSAGGAGPKAADTCCPNGSVLET